MGAVSQIAIIVPCYNEEQRLRLEDLAELLSDQRIKLTFVDDGSVDQTRSVLDRFKSEHPGRVELIALAVNSGKAEAVRRGLLSALQSGSALVGYVDADLATPVNEILRLADAAGKSDSDAVIGSRIAHLGASIERSAARHYLGRVFATAASLALGMNVYDTQCGAKFFKNSDQVAAALSLPFQSRWAFDVELLGRLIDRGQTIVEVPLHQWRDVGGSKMNLGAMLRAGVDVFRIAARHRRRRRTPNR